MKDDVNWNLLARYLFGECSEQEAAEVQAWIEEDPVRESLVEELRSFLRTTRSSPPAKAWDTEALWDRVQKDTWQEETDNESSKPADGSSTQNVSAQGSGSRSPRKRGSRLRRSRANRTFMQMAIVVGALVLAVATAVWLRGSLGSGPGTAPPEAKTFITQEGEQATIRLTDGTRVHLNVDSRLVVSATFGEGKRRVQLEGEAFFEVATDSARPFIVRANDATTRVLGTAFDVSAYPGKGETKVVVSEGRVAVRVNDPSPDESSSTGKREQNIIILTERQMGRIFRSGERVVRRGLEVDPHLAWLDGKLVFKRTSFEGVVRKLERWYDLRVSLEEGTAPPSGHLNARFAEDQPLSDVLSAIATAFGLEYERHEKRVTFVDSERPRSS